MGPLLMKGAFAMKKKSRILRIVNTIWETASGVAFLMPLLWMIS